LLSVPHHAPGGRQTQHQRRGARREEPTPEEVHAEDEPDLLENGSELEEQQDVAHAEQPAHEPHRVAGRTQRGDLLECSGAEGQYGYHGQIAMEEELAEDVEAAKL
jgi:hypothetical protein